jgi:hypothetical protein
VEDGGGLAWGRGREGQLRVRVDAWQPVRAPAQRGVASGSQRYLGQFSDDGKTIEGRWESSNDGSTWERDFQLNYMRLT